LHGDMSQPERNRAIRDIKSGDVCVLVATDVASRGLDIDDLSHVFNFHTPQNVDRYTHRIGRTGRAGRKGVAITLATPTELRDDYFYRSETMRGLRPSALPTRRDVQSKLNADMVAAVESMEVSEE